ncbi:MAG: DUF411 domain-containing protein [Acidobacteriota bacterium]
MSRHFSRREICGVLLGTAAAAVAWPRGVAGQAKPTLIVYKDPGCGCCEAWVTHMKANGFAATVTNTSNVDAIKKQHGVTDALASCHTALVGGYVIEGHVPAADVTRLLTEKPKTIKGLTIPGMPASAPGMDLKPFKPYTVLSFDAQGKTAVYASHPTA